MARKRRGKGFEYRDSDGNLVRDAETVGRVRALGIPPAWRDVWICTDPRGHLQATGFDVAGRRQYLYHPAWRDRREREKFDRMLDFATALPRLRRRVEADLGRDGLGRERVLACAVRLLDRGFFRIGGEDYAEDNGTFGLATLRREHVAIGERPRLTFDFVAKGGVRRRQAIVDEAAYDVVRALRRRRTGSELLAYKRGRTWLDVRSPDVNGYIRESAAGDFSAKDFRTWNGTVLAAVSLAVLGKGRAGSVSARKRVISLAVGEVARYLGNTPAVCRGSYIDPRVLDRFHAEVTIGGLDDRLGEWTDDFRAQREVELAVVDLLRGDVVSPALERTGSLDVAA